MESSLLDMYGKCGSGEARQVFNGMSKKNTVSWSALLGGYCQKGQLLSNMYKWIGRHGDALKVRRLMVRREE